MRDITELPSPGKKPFSQGKIEQYLERFSNNAPMHKRVETHL